MRIKCPICGERDRREYYYVGDAIAVDRPAPDAEAKVWDDYVHNRENPAGMTRDLWYHESGCGAWIVVTRSTLTHVITKTELASKLCRSLRGAIA